MLKEQFSKMEDTGNIEVPESSSTPTSARTFENFGQGNSTSVNFQDKNKRYSEGFFKISRNNFVIFGRFFEHFPDRYHPRRPRGLKYMLP